MDSGLLCCIVYTRIRARESINFEVTSLDRFYQFPFMKIFCHTFFKNCKSNKVETWDTHGEGVDVSCLPESGPRAHNS